MGTLVEEVSRRREPQTDYSAERAECARRGSHVPTLPGYRHYLERTMDFICPSCKTPYSIPMTDAEVIQMLKEMHPDSWREKLTTHRVH